MDVPLTVGNNVTLAAGGLPSDSTVNLLTGNVAGPLGCCAILVILACGLYLYVRGHLQLSTVVPYLLVCILIPWLLPPLNGLPTLSAPWEYVRQRVYLEKYIILSGAMLFGGVFLACEPVTQPHHLRDCSWRRRHGVPLLQHLRNRRLLCPAAGGRIPRMAGPCRPPRGADEIPAEGGEAPWRRLKTVNRAASATKPPR